MSHKLNPYDTEKMEWCIENYYKKKDEQELSAVYRRMLTEFYTYKDANGKLHPMAADDSPSLRQFRDFYKKYKKDHWEEILRARNTGTTYELECREVLHHLDEGCIGPGYCYLADATLMDIEAVSAFDRSINIGRPTLTVLIDLSSRATYIYISLLRECFATYRMCLHFAASDKTKYLSRFGCEKLGDAWPEEGILPSIILSDNSSMKTISSDRICANLGIHLETTQEFRPDEKGIVESAINLINKKFKEYIGNIISSRVRANGGDDYHEYAALTMHEIRALGFIINAELNRTREVHLTITPDLYNASFIPTPINIWHWGTENRSGYLRHESATTVNALLLPSDEGSISRNGVYFKKHLYDSPYAHEHGWYIKSSDISKGRFFYEEDYQGIIYYLDDGDDGTTLIEFYLLGDEKYTYTYVGREEEGKNPPKIKAMPREWNQHEGTIISATLSREITEKAIILRDTAVKTRGKMDTKNKKINAIPDMTAENNTRISELYGGEAYAYTN